MFTLLFFTAQVYTIVNYFYLQCVPCYKFSHVKIRDSLYNSKNCCIIYNMLHKLRRAFQVYLPQFKIGYVPFQPEKVVITKNHLSVKLALT